MGMGVLVLMIAVLPSTKANAVYIMKAEFGPFARQVGAKSAKQLKFFI